MGAVVVLLWECDPCLRAPMPTMGFYFQGLSREQLEAPPREPALHPREKCIAENETMRLVRVDWRPEEVTLDEVWGVVERIANPELFTVTGLGSVFQQIVRVG